MSTYTVVDQRKLLLDLMDIVQRFTDSSDRYFSQIGERQFLNPVKEDIQYFAHDVSESVPAEFFDELGIRSITLDKRYDSFSLPNGFNVSARRDINQYKWHVFRNTSFIENLRTVLRDCHVIAFSDWATVDGASQLWDGFLRDVIKPLNRTDINFIFYLGDVTRKLTHEVDEIIDIISDFSAHGSVTFLLHEKEAGELWKVLYGEVAGISPGPRDLRSRYQSIFNAMNVDRVLIYSINQAMALSGKEQFELTGRTIVNRKISQQMKDNFTAGYSLGLLLQLDIAHCIVLGLTAFGAFMENGISPNRKTLTAYIKSWIESLESQE